MPPKERPILFSGAMVRAILAGTKTQTRRVVKSQPEERTDTMNDEQGLIWLANGNKLRAGKRDWVIEGMRESCRYGEPGDTLWVRETWQINHVDYDRGPIPKERPEGDIEVLFRADGEFSEQFEIDEGGSGWRPSIFMPRWASRITLRITDVRVEQLHDMSGFDALKEGVTLPEMKNRFHVADPTVEFMDLWDSINGKTYPWDSNPWVWVISFERVE